VVESAGDLFIRGSAGALHLLRTQSKERAGKGLQGIGRTLYRLEMQLLLLKNELETAFRGSFTIQVPLEGETQIRNNTVLHKVSLLRASKPDRLLLTGENGPRGGKS